MQGREPRSGKSARVTERKVRSEGCREDSLDREALEVHGPQSGRRIGRDEGISTPPSERKDGDVPEVPALCPAMDSNLPGRKVRRERQSAKQVVPSGEGGFRVP
jgi:hypothetical protein